MLQNAYLLAKIGFDTAENGPHRFQKSAEWDTAAGPRDAPADADVVSRRSEPVRHQSVRLSYARRVALP